MTSGGWQDWVFWLAGAAAGTAGAALGAWALLWDRSRWRLRCPKCWYSMEGVPGAGGAAPCVCPECGRLIKSLNALLKTRRRPAWAVVSAFVLIVAYATFKAPEWRRSTWTALVPTSVLVLVAPASEPNLGYVRVFARAPVPTPSELLDAEAWSRPAKGKMWRWQSQIFFGRYLENTGVTLLDSVVYPVRWVEGEPIPLRLGKGPGLHRFFGASWRVEPVADAGEKRRAFEARLPPARAGESPRLRLHLRSDDGVIYSAAYILPTVIVKTKQEVIAPLDSEEATRRVRAALDIRIVDRGTEAAIVVDERDASPKWPPIYFGLVYRVEVLFDDEVVGRAGGSAAWDHFVIKGWSGLDSAEWVAGGLELVLADPHRATVVVTGDLDRAWRLYRAWPFDKPNACAWTGSYESAVRVDKVRERGDR